MIPIRDDVFNNLSWEHIDGLELDKAIEGLTVIGSEPTDYPLTDGITIYLKKPNGDVIALDIGADYFSPDEGENPFYTHLATIPAKQTQGA